MWDQVNVVAIQCLNVRIWNVLQTFQTAIQVKFLKCVGWRHPAETIRCSFLYLFSLAQEEISSLEWSDNVATKLLWFHHIEKRAYDTSTTQCCLYCNFLTMKWSFFIKVWFWRFPQKRMFCLLTCPFWVKCAFSLGSAIFHSQNKVLQYQYREHFYHPFSNTWILDFWWCH